MSEQLTNEPMSPNIHTPEWYDQRHHDSGGGYRNIWGNDRDTPFFKAVGWVAGRIFSNPPQVPASAKVLDEGLLRTSPDGIRVTWLGHATAYVEMGDLRILLDPMFSERASPFSFAGPRRLAPLPLQIEDLPGVDVVIISHDHYDHLDLASVRQLQEQFQPLFLVPLDVGDIVAKWGAERVRELDWWQWMEIGSLKVTCTPAQHFSGRGLTDRDGTLWASWFLESPQGSVYFGGDTGYASHFVEIRERLGAPNVAILPIGAYLPRWFMQVVHVNPAEAVQAYLDLEAQHMIPVHWGTFVMADDPLAEPPRLLREEARSRGLTDRVHVLEIGESWTLDAGPEGAAPGSG